MKGCVGTHESPSQFQHSSPDCVCLYNKFPWGNSLGEGGGGAKGQTSERERVACRKRRPSMTHEALHVTVSHTSPPLCAPGPSASLKQDVLELPCLSTLSPPAWDALLCCLQIPSHPSSLRSRASMESLLAGSHHAVGIPPLWPWPHCGFQGRQPWMNSLILRVPTMIPSI